MYWFKFGSSKFFNSMTKTSDDTWQARLKPPGGDKQLTLSQPGEQIMPTTVIQAPLDF